MVAKKSAKKTVKSAEYQLRLIEPPFDSMLTQHIIDLDYLRRQTKITETTPHEIFEQIKRIFFMVESLGSARIEGNHTTIIEYAESKLNPKSTPKRDSITEIVNLELAMDFIEANARDYPLNRMFVSELHKIAVRGLGSPPYGEGDRTPGQYRKEAVGIGKAKHTQPDAGQVPFLMEELFRWMESDQPSRYDLLKTALAHHRFVWIHPFTNGNGRTARLFTYAMLVKYGLTLTDGRLVNPTAVFCSSRDTYYARLAEADTGKKKGLYNWCEYVLGGLKTEINKVNRLCDYEFLADKLLKPSIRAARRDEIITESEEKILLLTVDKREIKLADIKLPQKKTDRSTSRYVQSLREKGMLVATVDQGRIYRLQFMNNHLLRYVIAALDKNGFLPMKMDE